MVESLPTPDNFDPAREYLFLPTTSRLAFTVESTLLVWDAQHHKYLLNSVDNIFPGCPTFSSDGCFFACGTDSPDIYLWRESSIGYILHQKLTSNDVGSCIPFLSPSGQSIIMSSGLLPQLWHTTNSTTSSSSVATWDPEDAPQFILGFSPDRSLAVAAQLKSNVATVIDLKSSATQLTIDVGVGICGLKITRSTVIAVGDGKIIT